MTGILAATLLIIIMMLPKWRRENREHKQYMDALDQQRKMYEDPDYWKEHKVVTGWDRDYVYNKYGHHIITVFGGDQMRTQKEKWTKMWSDMREEWIKKYPN